MKSRRKLEENSKKVETAIPESEIHFFESLPSIYCLKNGMGTNAPQKPNRGSRENTSEHSLGASKLRWEGE